MKTPSAVDCSENSDWLISFLTREPGSLQVMWMVMWRNGTRLLKLMWVLWNAQIIQFSCLVLYIISTRFLFYILKDCSSKGGLVFCVSVCSRMTGSKVRSMIWCDVIIVANGAIKSHTLLFATQQWRVLSFKTWAWCGNVGSLTLIIHWHTKLEWISSLLPGTIAFIA